MGTAVGGVEWWIVHGVLFATESFLNLMIAKTGGAQIVARCTQQGTVNQKPLALLPANSPTVRMLNSTPASNGRCPTRRRNRYE